MNEKEIVCTVCMHHCHLKEGQIGRCKARKNYMGESICINYGKLTGFSLDPIEKKPLLCFYPGSMILSVGSFGCNLNCPFCQNHSIAMAGEQETDSFDMPPMMLVQQALAAKSKGNIGLAFTYNEPLVGFEYVRDTARLIHEHDMKNIVVTNGSISEIAAKEILPHIDAYNIDLKGFTPEYYKKLGGDLEMVKEFIKLAAKVSHVELTTLIVPAENDSMEEMSELSQWVAHIDPDIPLHITRFFPRRKMQDKRPTDIPLLYELAEVAKKNLSRVFIGNV